MKKTMLEIAGCARASSTSGRPCPVSDLFGVEGGSCSSGSGGRRGGGERHRLGPADRRPRGSDRRGEPAPQQGHAEHPYVPLSLSDPGIGWVLAFTIAAEIGEIERFSEPQEAGGPRADPRVVE